MIEADVNAEIRAQPAGHHPPEDPDIGCRGGSGSIRRKIMAMRSRAQHGPPSQALFDRAMRRHPCRGDRRYRHLQIIAESAVSSGVRRIEALTAKAHEPAQRPRDKLAKPRYAQGRAGRSAARVAALVEQSPTRARTRRGEEGASMGGGSAKTDTVGPSKSAAMPSRPKWSTARPQEPPQRSRRDETTPRQRHCRSIALNEGRASVSRRRHRRPHRNHLRRRPRENCGRGPRRQGGGGRPDMAQGGGVGRGQGRRALVAIKDTLAGVPPDPFAWVYFTVWLDDHVYAVVARY